MTSADTFTMAVDVIDQAVPLVATQATHAIRHERAKVVASTQGSYDAMFAPDVQGISLTERLLVALYACRLSNSGRLADHYQQRLVQDGADLGLVEAINMNTLSRVPAGRMQTILRFTSKLIERPIDGDRQALEELVAVGLSTPAIVALSQLIAFLSYQTRVTAGLQAMAALAPGLVATPVTAL